MARAMFRFRRAHFGRGFLAHTSVLDLPLAVRGEFAVFGLRLPRGFMRRFMGEVANLLRGG